jgi:hypothetical protein
LRQLTETNSGCIARGQTFWPAQSAHGKRHNLQDFQLDKWPVEGDLAGPINQLKQVRHLF